MAKNKIVSSNDVIQENYNNKTDATKIYKVAKGGVQRKVTGLRVGFFLANDWELVVEKQAPKKEDK